MSKAIITKGLSGSGKTFWAKSFVEKNKDWVRINRDDLRNMRGAYWIPKQEDLITDWELSLLDISVKKGYNIVLDNTSLNPKVMNKLKKFFEERKVELEIKDFTDVPLEVCIKRDLQRANSVGQEVIIKQYNKYLKKDNENILIQNKELPSAIIVDLDGTLALFGDKNPYERDFINDTVNEPVKNILNLENSIGTIILIFSGRNGKFKSETEEWLKNNEIKYNRLYMRNEIDNRKDSIVKKEMLDNYAKNKYYIKYVIDDRGQVVKLWKSLGLFVFDVNQSGEVF
jgi:predicted kinase